MEFTGGLGDGGRGVVHVCVFDCVDVSVEGGVRVGEA